MVYADPEVPLRDKRLAKHQAELLREFYEEKTATGRCTRNTLSGYTATLRDLAVFFPNKHLDKITKKDLIAFFNKKNWKSNAPKIHIKVFYRWLWPNPAKSRKQYSEGKPYPDVVAWLAGSANSKRELPDGILTRDEITRLVKHAGNQRNSGIIMILYETAARASEFLGIRIMDIEFDSYGARIQLKGKTGSRRVRVVDSVPYIKAILNQHTDSDKPSARLISIRSNAQLGVILDNAAKKANLGKDIFPHLFRHSRLTEMAKILPEPALRVFAGWSATSRMPAIYVHLSGADIDNMILRDRGLIEKGKEGEIEEKRKLEAVLCRKCGFTNPHTSDYCVCGEPLTPEAIAKYDEEDKTAIRLKEKLLLARIERLEKALSERNRYGRN